MKIGSRNYIAKASRTIRIENFRRERGISGLLELCEGEKGERQVEWESSEKHLWKTEWYIDLSDCAISSPPSLSTQSS